LYAACRNAITLTPGLAKGVEIEATGFNSGNDVLTALVSKSIDVAQVTYLHYVTALDKGFDVVAVVVRWNPKMKKTIRQADLHHSSDYTPWKGFEVTGWPVMTIARGRVVAESGRIVGEKGAGDLLSRGTSGLV
jgi:dihydroorotase-like cyclic amidohydrolase